MMVMNTHRRLSLTIAMLMVVASMAQTYLQPTVGQQGTYTGACMVSTCSGTFYDNGGAAGNYAANVNNIFRTFCPSAPGMCVRATFSQFVMNDTYFLCFGPNSCCDYLQILNGPVQNSPALYSNCLASPGTITASNPSGCLTFRFVSDGSVQLAGWTATLSCVPCGIGPSGTTNGDCAYATPVCADTPFSDASPGPGITAEGCSGCVTSENYTNWYRIQIQTSGTLAFTINPNNNADDFDPVVFGPNVTCAALGNPVRCSYAINSGNGNTGLGNGAVDNSETVTGDQWVAPMAVTAGQTYYVMINGWSATSGANGFLLDWTGTASLNCSILPVELLYMKANCESGVAMVEWATGAEVNSSHFVVERSSDGVEWAVAGRVNAARFSEHQTQYIFTDPKAPGARGTYYRLREVDLDGDESVSDVVRMASCLEARNVLTAMPNPVNEVVKVDIDLSETIEAATMLQVLDATGRSVLSRQVNVSAGLGTAMLDLSPLAPGAYVLSLDRLDLGRVGQLRVVKQ